MAYQIPIRCVHCCAPIRGAWHPWHVLWSVCQDCRAWQEWLWQQRAPARVTDPYLTQAITEAIAEGNLPGEDR